MSLCHMQDRLLLVISKKFVTVQLSSSCINPCCQYHSGLNCPLAMVVFAITTYPHCNEHSLQLPFLTLDSRGNASSANRMGEETDGRSETLSCLQGEKPKACLGMQGDLCSVE